MEIVTKCLLCDHTGQTPLITSYEPSLGMFCLVQCTNCKLIYLSPRVEADQISAYYPDDYHPFTKAIEDENSWIRRLSRLYDQKKRCDAVERWVQKKGKILDVGCSTGIFLDSMQKRGWQGYGVEPSEYAARYGQERFGLNIWRGYLVDAMFEDNFFDVITFWDVLEHVYSPDETLSEVWRILKPGGLLLINLPNPEAWERSLFGKYWLGWDIPRHLFIFSLRNLKTLLQKVGLNYEGVSSFTGRHNAMVMSFQAFLKGHGTGEARQRFILSMIRSLPIRAVLYPFFMLASWCNRSSFMTVYARKPEKK